MRDDTSRKHTNVFQMYASIDGRSNIECFYDPGLGAPAEGELAWTRTFRNLWSKATGWGITANVVDCYEALLTRWAPDRKIGLFGFSRGAYTVRCLGGVLATCGIATAASAANRRGAAEEAVAIYKIKDKTARGKAAQEFASRYQAVAAIPDVIGVYDTVKALGLPGIMDLVNPYRHEFHDNELSVRIPLGLHALSIDENRKTFAPELWDDPDEATAGDQIIEQCWFPGVHSDIGGGYDDNRLADNTLAWMLERLDALAGLKFPISVATESTILGPAHDERTGFGKLWRAGNRTIRGESVEVASLCRGIERRFKEHVPRYRPAALSNHPRVKPLY
ncbi:MAG: DUF2235 domain-containing protein [Rhizobiaceae bacterium]|nr:DUF2235 domain-containing protein [Rhizobiaceae bacterium]